MGESSSVTIENRKLNHMNIVSCHQCFILNKLVRKHYDNMIFISVIIQ